MIPPDPSSQREQERRPTLQAALASDAPLPRTGDIGQLFEEHHQRVFRAAHRIMGNVTDAEDVMQNVFLRLIRREHEAASVSNIESYLHRAAINAALDLLRSRQSAPGVSLETVEPWLESGRGENTEVQMWLRQALAKLAPRPAEMFVLRYLEGHNNREIARMLNTSQAVVAVTLHRTRGQLQKEFQKRVH